MKFTLSWLKSHLDTTATLDEICIKLTSLGLEVENVVDPAKALAPFIIAEVLTAEQHPQADRLKVCTVNTGSETLQIVCGAPNARAGIKTVLARPGDVMPDSGQKLKKGTIRGVESQGMLCAADELMLTDVESDGIMELPLDAPVGGNFASFAHYDDPIIEINLTPNRADCAGVRGVARDLAAAGLGQLKPLDSAPVPAVERSAINIRLDFPADDKACPLFAGRIIRGLKNQPSPLWLQQQLKAIGLRPVSAMVDITNYLTFDLARPLHVFDAKKLRGDLWVRPAAGGEAFNALNDKQYKLAAGMTVIGDDSGVISLAGIMGGIGTACGDGTTDVLIEAAYFDLARTAKTGRALQIASDARYRFERGVDPLLTLSGAEIATRLLVELCGTIETTVGEMIIAGQPPMPAAPLSLAIDKVEKYTGVAVSATEQADILTRLGFKVKAAGGSLTVEIPSWRPDVTGAVDLVEEIIRVKGYDLIPAVSLPGIAPVTKPALDADDRRGFALRHALAAQGLLEAVTWSFMPIAIAQHFLTEGAPLKLENPISSELDTLRPSIIGNLVMAAKQNADRGFKDVGLFELGPVFSDASPEGQRSCAAILRAGSSSLNWLAKPRAVDAYDAKADVLAALASAGVPVATLQTAAEAPGYYHPGRSGSIKMGNQVLAYFGELHPALLAACDAAGPMVGAEILLQNLPQSRSGNNAKPLLKFNPLQAVERDFAFVLDRAVPVAKLIKAVKDAEKNLIRSAVVFDVYEGEHIDATKKSVALRVTLQPADKSLTDAEIELVAAAIVTGASKAGATLRN